MLDYTESLPVRFTLQIFYRIVYNRGGLVNMNCLARPEKAD